MQQDEISPVPVSLRILVKRRKHDGQDDIDIVADQVAKVLVIPEVERALRNLGVSSAITQPG